MNRIDKQISLVMRPMQTPIAGEVLINLGKLPCLSQVLDCINRNQAFGLSRKGNKIMFDPAELTIYDYAGGELTKTICPDNTSFLNYLKLASVCHTTFVTASKCIEMVKPKRLIITDINN